MRSVLRKCVDWALVFSLVATVASVVSLVSTKTAKADNLYASIRGRVLDAGGGVVPDVKITALNALTGVPYTATTQKDGSFSILQVTIGDYKLTAEKQGFTTFVEDRIHLDLNQVFEADIRLEVGALSQQIMVEANQAQVETASSQLGIVINSNDIVNLPLLGRNWINLQQLEPGVVAASDGRGDFATNGSESQQNSYLIDGTDTNDLPLNTPLIVPSPDAIGEFRMVTGSINPEYGRNSGAILNAVTKSGSNQFHGDAFEFYRDPFLNTHNFFSKKPAVFHQNQFGGTVGGPVIKNHTFFFFSYQGIRNRQPQTTNGGGNTTVYDSSVLNPSNLGAGANFGTNILGANTSPFALTGSDGKTYAAGTPYSTVFGCSGGTTPGCTVGFVPSADINPISAKLIQQFVPAPNTGTNQFEFNPVQAQITDQYIVRIDQTFNSKDSLWGTWFIQKAPRTLALPFTGATLPGFAETDDSHDKFLTLSWSHVFNGQMVNELRGGYTRLNFNAVNPSTPVAPSSVGFGITPQLTSGEGLPVIAVKGLFTLGFSANGPQPRIDQTYEAVDNFSITAGRHTMKFGFDMRRFQVNNPFAGNNDGNFQFQGNGAFSTKDAGADFLLGIPDNYAQTSGGFINARAQEYYSYAQDQYKLRPNLTITYGVGWQIDTPISDLAYNNHAEFAFRPTQQSVVFPGAPLGYVFNGDPGVHPAGTAHYFKNFGPRFGFAYSPDFGGRLTGGAGKTSLRGGVGIYYNRFEEEQTLQFNGGAPFTFSTTGAGHPSFANPFVDIATGAAIAQPFPFAGPAQNVNFAQFLPLYQGTAGFDPNIQDPMAINYNLTLERQIGSSAVLSIGYVGSVGHRLTVGTPINIVTNNAPCLADPKCGPLNQDALHPEDFLYNPQIYGTIDNIATRGSSNYNSAQISFNKHLSHGLQFLASYTYSHSLDNTSGFENSAFGGGGFGGFASLRASDPYNLSADYGNSIFDAKHRGVISYVYNIPSARHFNALAWMPSRVTDGWAISGITTWQSGFPLDVVDGNLSSLLCTAPEIQDFACPDAPNLVGAVTYSNPRSATGHQWFSPGAFAPEPAGSFGNAGRNLLRGPGINNWDFQLYKDTHLTERTRFELRIEFYNIFNHTQFNPNGIITDISDPRFGREFSASTNNISSRLIQLATKFYF